MSNCQSVPIDFAAQEPTGQAGRGHHDSRPTLRMETYLEQRAKANQATARRQESTQPHHIIELTTSSGQLSAEAAFPSHFGLLSLLSIPPGLFNTAQLDALRDVQTAGWMNSHFDSLIGDTSSTGGHQINATSTEDLSSIRLYNEHPDRDSFPNHHVTENESQHENNLPGGQQVSTSALEDQAVQMQLISRSANHVPQGGDLPSPEKDQTDRPGSDSRGTMRSSGNNANATAQSAAKENNPLDHAVNDEGNEDSDVSNQDDCLRQRLTEGAYPFMRAHVATICGFPEDHVRSTLTRDSFLDSYREQEQRGIDLRRTSRYPMFDKADLIEDRIPQTRRAIKTFVVSNLECFFSFTHCSSKDNAIKQKNRELYGALTKDDAFIYQNPDDISIPNTVYRHPYIIFCINKIWFDDDTALGIKHRKLFEDGQHALPSPCIALVVTAIQCALDEWKGGSRCGGRNGIKFSERDYGPVFNDHLTKLRGWEEYTTASGSLATLKLRQEYLQEALNYAGAPQSGDDEAGGRRNSESARTASIWANNNS
ncbi:hypothetical protein NM688_g4490 [Phlebia brevispora]|uniref:Uncharacterized protein n=1 Tax=Phlebia brevispora TaxID=194682 RepID=A0ACC1T2P6_9APHY|nr:hypothetical protein NM688_g4490 [Phlebia brevispora]